MPQIAQQDYLIVKRNTGLTPDNDMRFLAGLVGALEKHILFDVLVYEYVPEDSFTYMGRVLGYNDEEHMVYYHCGSENAAFVEYQYTATQYEGLAAVQDALARKEGSYQDQPTALSSTDNYLFEGESSYAICDEDGHKIIISVDGDNNLVSVAISEEIEENGLLVPFEEIQKLIGLPVA